MSEKTYKYSAEVRAFMASKQRNYRARRNKRLASAAFATSTPHQLANTPEPSDNKLEATCYE